MLDTKQTNFLLDIPLESLTFNMLTALIGNTSDIMNPNKINPPMYNMTDAFILPVNTLNNSTKLTTTVGKYLFNMLVLKKSGVIDITGYINTEFTMSELENFENYLGDLLKNGKISAPTIVSYIDNRDYIGLGLHYLVCTSFTMKVLNTPKEVRDLKAKLLKDHADKIKEGDLSTINNIEKTLLAKAKESLKGDPGMELYDSGARGSFNNNYKNVNLIKGPIYNGITEKFDIVTSCLIDGMEIEDLPAYGNSLVAGEYVKAVGTKVSGYLAKQLIAALQTEIMDEVGSDCGSKATIPIVITQSNMSKYLERYVLESNKLVKLTNDNIKNYMNKTVHMRSPMGCVSDKKCNICMGDDIIKYDIKSVGLWVTSLSGTLTNANMKARHDSTIKLHRFSPDNIILK